MNPNTIDSFTLLDQHQTLSCRSSIVREAEFSAQRGLFAKSDSSRPHSHRSRLCAARTFLAACLMVLVNFPMIGRSDDSLSLYFTRNGIIPAYTTNRSSTGVSLQESSFTTLSSGEAKIALDGFDGNFTAKSSIAYDENGNYTILGRGAVASLANSGQTLTIATDPALNGNAGTLQINYSILGSFSPGYNAGIYSTDDFFRVTVNGFTFSSGYNGGAPLPQTMPGNLSVTQAITFSSSGTAVGLNLEVYAYIACDFLPFRGNAERRDTVSILHLAVRPGAIRLLDSTGKAVSFTSTSSTGSARGSNILSGATYAGFSLSNTTNHGHLGSTLTLLDGTASSNTSVRASFTGPPAKIHPVSDAVDLSGTGSDPVVVQLDYDLAHAQAVFGSAATLGLAWLNPTTGDWVNAVLGNIGGTSQFISRAYDAATDFHLGNFGLDTITKTVWAVVNHNSQFTVTDLKTLQVPSITRLADGHVFFQFAGVPDAVNHVEASPDLSPGSFVPVESFMTGPSGAVGYEDTNAGNLSKRFYRVSSP